MRERERDPSVKKKEISRQLKFVKQYRWINQHEERKICTQEKGLKSNVVTLSFIQAFQDRLHSNKRNHKHTSTNTKQYLHTINTEVLYLSRKPYRLTWHALSKGNVGGWVNKYIQTPFQQPNISPGRIASLSFTSSFTSKTSFSAISATK